MTDDSHHIDDSTDSKTYVTLIHGDEHSCSVCGAWSDGENNVTVEVEDDADVVFTVCEDERCQLLLIQEVEKLVGEAGEGG